MLRGAQPTLTGATGKTAQFSRTTIHPQACTAC
jgi:hypothetical protein